MDNLEGRRRGCRGAGVEGASQAVIGRDPTCREVLRRGASEKSVEDIVLVTCVVLLSDIISIIRNL